MTTATMPETSTIGVARAALVEALGRVLPALPQRTVLPVLACVRLDIAGGLMRITATDLDRRAQVELEVECEDEMTLCVPGKLLSEVLGKMSGISVTLEPTAGALLIRGGGSRIKVNTVSPDEWPTQPRPEGEPVEVQLPKAALLGGLADVRFAAADPGKGKGVMEGVYLHGTGADLRAVGLNGVTLAVRTLDPVFTAPLSMVLTASTVDLAMRMLGGVDAEHIDLTKVGEWITLRAGSSTLTARRLSNLTGDTDYVPYEGIIPDWNKATTTVEISREELLAAVARAQLVANELMPAVACAFGDDGMQIQAQSDRGQMRETVTGAEVSGKPWEIGFNAHVLRTSLVHMPAGTLVGYFGFSQPTFTAWRSKEDGNVFQMISGLRK